jgi:glucose/arabinose dehydrogenase
MVRRCVLLVAAVLLAGCNSPDKESTKEPGSVLPPSTAAPVAAGGTCPVASGPAAGVSNLGGVKLTQVATLSQPVDMAMRPGEDAFYFAEKGGRLRVVRGGQVDPRPVVDISGEVSKGAEQGLLGLVFSPDGAFLYIHFTNQGDDVRVVEYAVRDGRVDVASRREVLAVEHPFKNHHGGQLVFGKDRRLYIAIGDGGSGNDPMNNAQRLDSLLGKILRIDPRPSGGAAYGIPQDNPFVGRQGAKGEIWLYGLRNPWRVSFDRRTDDLWIGDVGQNALEEIDFCPAGTARGANFGWAAFEGTRRNTVYRLPPPPEHVPPVHEYPTDEGCAVTGGFVYRGGRVPALQGLYLMADFCNGKLFALRQEGGRVVERKSLGLTVDQLSSFGQDTAGEIYALSLDGGVFRFDPA